MADEIIKQNDVQPIPVNLIVPSKDKGVNDRGGRGSFRGGSGSNSGRPDRRRSREERPRAEFDQKILNIRRVTRVASGGRRFSFSVAIVLGNRKGSVGVGTGKAGDTSLAIDKATKNAKKNLLKLALTKTSSIPYEIRVKYSSARVLIMPAKGRGLIAGSALRDVLDLAGVKDVAGKIFSGSKNKLNIARATVKALSAFASNKLPVADSKKIEKDLPVVID